MASPQGRSGFEFRAPGFFVKQISLSLVFFFFFFLSLYLSNKNEGNKCVLLYLFLFFPLKGVMATS